jgi:putative nucleotidyltransferase with HDIG domain
VNQLQTEQAPETVVQPAPWALADLPPFPWLAKRLMATLAKEDVDIYEVDKLIAAEPVFATRVLQLANSPLFALQRQVRTISHAIILLGLERVKAITLTRALQDFVRPAMSIQALRLCWQNSLAVALLAEKLARAAGMDADFAYVAGLLRDIGRLLLLMKYPEPYSNVLAVSADQQFDLMALEKELFDIDHCEAGSWLMLQLAFPPELTEIVAHHHEKPNPHRFDMLQLVQCADRLAEALGFGIQADLPAPSIDEALHQMPEAARVRLGNDEQRWRTDIASRLRE